MFRKISLALVLGLTLAGCSSAANPASTTKISIMAPYMTTTAPASNKPIITKLEALTKTTLNFDWVANAAYTDQLNLTLASGKMPQIIVFKDKDATFVKYAKAHTFWNLTKYLKDYPHLAQANQRVLHNSSLNGQVYGIYRARDLMRASVTLRADWLKKLNLSRPTTLDQLTAVMQAFTNDDPDGDGRADTYGMVLNKWNGIGNGAPWEIVATWLGAPNGWGVKANTLYPAFMSPAYLKALQWFRQEIKAGVINPDFATSTDNLEEMFIKGRGGSFIQPAYAMADLGTRTSTANLAKIYTFTGNLQATAAPHAWTTNGYSGLLAIPRASVKSVKQLRRILAFIDQTCTTKAQVLMTNGIEGQNFKVDSKDNTYATPINTAAKQYQTIVNQTTNVSQLQTAVSGQKSYLIVPKPLQALATRRYQTMAQDQKHAVYNQAAPYVSATYSKKGAQLDAIINTAQLAYMSGQLSDAGWQAAIQQWLKQGGQQVINEYTAQYRKR